MGTPASSVQRPPIQRPASNHPASSVQHPASFLVDATLAVHTLFPPSSTLVQPLSRHGPKKPPYQRFASYARRSRREYFHGVLRHPPRPLRARCGTLVPGGESTSFPQQQHSKQQTR